MSDEKGLGGNGIKGLRKSLLTPSPPWKRRTFRYSAECDVVCGRDGVDVGFGGYGVGG